MTPQISTALLKTQSDARLALMVAAGQERAFEALVARYERPLRRYCRRMLSDALAEDVVQQAFLALWSQLRGGTEVRELRPWLYRVAHNAALNTIKRAGYHYEQLDETIRSDDGPDAVLERAAAMRDTVAALQALPERQREALVRTAIDGESRTIVALDLGLTDGAVGQLLHRARNTLRTTATAITPLPLVAWLAGRHVGAAPQLLQLGSAKAGAAGSVGGTGGTAATGGTVAGTATAGGAAGGVSVGTTAGLTSIALKGAALLAVGLVAAATPVVAKRAFSTASPRSFDSAVRTDRMSPLRLASTPLGPVTSGALSAPAAAPAQTTDTGAPAAGPTSTDTTSTDAAPNPDATAASAADPNAGTDTTTDPGIATDTTGATTDTTATADSPVTTDPTATTDPGTTTDPATTTDPGPSTDRTATTSTADPSSGTTPTPTPTPTPGAGATP